MSPIAALANDAVATWVQCATCWGQRQIFEDRNGEGLVPCTCPSCLGVGEQLAVR